MKNLKAAFVALAVAAVYTVSAQADTLALSADSNPSPFAEQYQFTSNPVAAASFSDVVNLTDISFRDLVASLSGSSDSGISFTSFDLYNSSNVLVSQGVVQDFSARLSFGALESASLNGDFYIKITGQQSGLSSYNGNITLTSAVPEPQTYALMLAGLGLIGFSAARKRS